jgi:hypothetical protein
MYLGGGKQIFVPDFMGKPLYPVERPKKRLEDNIMDLGRPDGLWMMKLAKVHVR